MPDTEQWPVWVNGRPAASIATDNRGLAYGDGLFETILVKGGSPLLADWHWQRLRTSCERLGLSPDFKALHTQLESFCAALQFRAWAVVKLICVRQSGGRGYRPLTPDCDIILSSAAADAPQAAVAWQRGVRVAILDFRCSTSPVLGGIKHLNRLDQVLASAEAATRGLDEGVLCDRDGFVAGACAASIFYRSGNTLSVIRHPDCGVDGTMAAFIAAHSEAWLALPARKKKCRDTDLKAADEVFCCNALRGIWPVIAIDDKQLPIGDMTRGLQAHLSSGIFN